MLLASDWRKHQKMPLWILGEYQISKRTVEGVPMFCVWCGGKMLFQTPVAREARLFCYDHKRGRQSVANHTQTG